MKTFTDNAGRIWTISINVAAMKRVRGLLGVDLYRLVDDDFIPLGKLLSDPVQLCDVLYCLCKDEADAKTITDEDFGKALAGDAILMASNAFVEELSDFFPDARIRAAMKAMVAKGRQIQDRLLEHLESLVEHVDVNHVASAWIASHGGSPASSDSTPAPSPSPSS